MVVVVVLVVKVQIQVSEPTRARLKSMAFLSGKTMGEVVEVLLDGTVDKYLWPGVTSVAGTPLHSKGLGEILAGTGTGGSEGRCESDQTGTRNHALIIEPHEPVAPDQKITLVNGNTIGEALESTLETHTRYQENATVTAPTKPARGASDEDLEGSGFERCPHCEQIVGSPFKTKSFDHHPTCIYRAPLPKV